MLIDEIILMYYSHMERRDSSLKSPPAFLRLAGHPIRWRLLTELGRSDREVRELTRRLGEPQSLVSYHLGRLRAGGLVSMRRSSADGRDAYYRIDLVRCQEQLGTVGASLHPALGAAPAAPAGASSGKEPVSILFACTGNSSRSQLAEAFARHLAGDLDVVSAGSDPKPIHPHAIRIADDYGLDLQGAQSKHLDQFRHAHFDYVVTLCDRVREVCPEFDGAPERIHWSIPDPADAAAGRVTFARFQGAAADIRTRVEFFLKAITQRATEGGTHA